MLIFSGGPFAEIQILETHMISTAGIYHLCSQPDLPMEEREVPIAEIQGIEMPVKDGFAKHSLVSIPFNCRRLEHLRDEKKTGYSTFNIVMTETCPYMASEFSAVVYAFNKFLAPFLDGEYRE